MRRLLLLAPAAYLLTCFLSVGATAQSKFGWSYATFLGGRQADGIASVVRDANGYIYVGGGTSSQDFPVTPGAYQTTFAPGADGASVGFIAKYTPQGQKVWATFFGTAGGVGGTQITGVAVDPAGDVYATGAIGYGASVPITPGSPSVAYGEQFVAKFDSSGTHLLYSGIFGGDPNTVPRIVVDDAGTAYIIGVGGCCGNLQQSAFIGPGGGIEDFFVAAINPQGTQTTWAVIMGGTGLDTISGLTRAANGNLYVTGYSDSNDFPCRGGAVCNTGNGHATVVRLDPSQPPAQSVVYAAKYGGLQPANTFLMGEAIAVDAAGNAFVAADTTPAPMPVAPFAFQPKPLSVGSSFNTYVFKLSPSGTAVTGGTYITGDEGAFAQGIAVDGKGNVYVSGTSESHNFLTTAYTAVQSRSGDHGYEGGFYVKLNPSFAAVSSIRFGTEGNYASVGSIALDGAGGLWGAGFTGPAFPTTSNASQPAYAGNSDAFLLHTAFPPSCGTGATGMSFCAAAQSSSLNGRVRFIAQAEGPHPFHNIVLRVDGLIVDGLRAQQFDSNYVITAGTHTATMTATDAAGVVYSKSRSFAVAPSACPVNPTSPSLTICFPRNAGLVTGPVNFQVIANSLYPPGSLKLYIDGAYAGTVPQGSTPGHYARTLTVSKGVRRFTVTAVNGLSDYLYTTTIATVR